MGHEPLDHEDPQDERWERIARYLAEESPPAEIGEVERWLAEDPARAALLHQLRGALDLAGFAPPVPGSAAGEQVRGAQVSGTSGAQVSGTSSAQVSGISGARVSGVSDADVSGPDVEAALARVHERMEADTVRPITSARRRTLRSRLWHNLPLRAAAALLLLLGGQAIYRALRPAADAPPPTLAARTFETPVGRGDTVQLADGSTVVLAPASRLVVGEAYGEQQRSVTLEGVAWFDVQDGGPHFTVLAGDALVTDLGTSFTVRADPAQPVSVTVTEGRVRLALNTGTDSGVILRAGQSGVLAGGVARVQDRDDQNALAWTRGRLVFADAPFPQVAAELRRWYGVRLVAADSALAVRHLTSEFQGEPLEAVIAVVALALDARVVTRGDTIILHSLQ